MITIIWSCCNDDRKFLDRTFLIKENWKKFILFTSAFPTIGTDKSIRLILTYLKIVRRFKNRRWISTIRTFWNSYWTITLIGSEIFLIPLLRTVELEQNNFTKMKVWKKNLKFFQNFIFRDSYWYELDKSTAVQTRRKIRP